MCAMVQSAREDPYVRDFTPTRKAEESWGRGRVRIPGISNFRDNKILVNVRERLDSYEVAFFFFFL